MDVEKGWIFFGSVARYDRNLITKLQLNIRENPVVALQIRWGDGEGRLSAGTSSKY